jgi:shikimate O-hydroxycinnamoyltransferase
VTLMYLAPVDYVFTGNMSCPVTFAFSFTEQLDPRKLESSLAELLACIPWLGGRLCAVSESALAYEVEERPSVALSVTTTDKSFDELRDRDLVPLVKSFDREVLMHARLTQTPEGSVLGVSMSHALVDGFSFFLAMQKWAALTRGEQVEAPVMERLLRAPESYVAAALSGLDEHRLFENTGLFLSEPRPAVETLPRQERMYLSSAALAELFADAQRSVDQKITKNDVLTAWLWRTYGAQLWSDADNPDVYMSCPVDVRRLLGEENKNAFGCTINTATARATRRELMHLSLGQLATRIQQSVSRVFASDPFERVATLEALRRLYGLRGPQSIQLRHPQRGMVVTNMSRLPLAQLDFGCGAPTTARLVVEVSGMAAVLPARDGVAVTVYRDADATTKRPTPRATALRKSPSDRTIRW